MTAVDLAPVPIAVSPVRRVPQLLGGLLLYGISMGLQIRSVLGLDPWDVFHDALSKRTGLSFGTITAITGAVVLLCWLPLRQRPGVGTVSNILLIAVAVDTTLYLLPTPSLLVVRILLLVAGVVLNGLATAAYIGARLGPGPRGRPDDRVACPHRALGPAGAHAHRGGRAGDRLAARRHRRHRHRHLRPLDRPAHPGLPPPGQLDPPLSRSAGPMVWAPVSVNR
jgi:hypothetical protein